MSEKNKRAVVFTEKTDDVRFRDIVKISDDIIQTAYPSEKADEAEKVVLQRESINPFIEDKKQKATKLAPDGRILVEDDPIRGKRETEFNRRKRKSDKQRAKQTKRYEKLHSKIKKIEPKLALIRNKKRETENPAEFQRLCKKEEHLSKKIGALDKKAVSPDQVAPVAGFYIKARIFKMWIVALVVLVLITAVLSTALISVTYKNLKHYQGDSKLQRQSVNALNSEVSSLNEEKDIVTQKNKSLEKENSELSEKISELQTEVSDYKSENEQLQIKADFLLKNIRIVNGNFFRKTYHIYGCTKADYSSYWAYNKEQVEGKKGYIACPHCIK